MLPVLSEQFNSTDVLFYHALRAARDTMHLQPGDNVVMTGGITNGKSGNTNLIKIGGRSDGRKRAWMIEIQRN